MARSSLSRLITELRGAPGARDADDALARLRVRAASDGSAEIVEDAAEQAARGLGDLDEGSYPAVRISRGVYEHVPTARARVRLLELASRAAHGRVAVHVIVSGENTHLGRLAIDAPRRLLRLAGARVAEPGDRLAGARFVHAFFDEEALLVEIARAGLVVDDRSGFTFTLRRAGARERSAAPEQAGPFATELGRVTRALREIDARRAADAPAPLLARLRERGERCPRRGPIGRARLRRAIGWVDALAPGGPSCYRRVLLEVALDRGAATETVVFGLDVGSTGHVAFDGREERTFDVAFAIPAAPPRTRP